MDEQFEEARVEQFLSPLGAISPATRRPRPPVRVRRLAAIALAAVVIFGGGAIAATRVFGPLHNATITPIPTRLSCSGLIASSGDRAASYLAAHGYRVSWRFQTFGSKVLSPAHGSQPGAVAGYSKTVATPPAGSIVSDVLRIGPHSVVVLTQGRDDPNAPRIVPPSCSGNR